jgi:hypothetical protein
VVELVEDLEYGSREAAIIDTEEDDKKEALELGPCDTAHSGDDGVEKVTDAKNSDPAVSLRFQRPQISNTKIRSFSISTFIYSSIIFEISVSTSSSFTSSP